MLCRICIRVVDDLDRDLDHTDNLDLGLPREMLCRICIIVLDHADYTAPARQQRARPYRSYRSGIYPACLADLHHEVVLDHLSVRSVLFSYLPAVLVVRRQRAARRVFADILVGLGLL